MSLLVPALGLWPEQHIPFQPAAADSGHLAKDSSLPTADVAHPAHPAVDSVRLTREMACPLQLAADAGLPDADTACPAHLATDLVWPSSDKHLTWKTCFLFSHASAKGIS